MTVNSKLLTSILLGALQCYFQWLFENYERKIKLHFQLLFFSFVFKLLRLSRNWDFLVKKHTKNIIRILPLPRGCQKLGYQADFFLQAPNNLGRVGKNSISGDKKKEPIFE